MSTAASHAAPARVARATDHSLVANREVEGRAGVRPAVNPASGEPFGAASLLDEAQLRDAVAAAAAAALAWAGLSFRERGAVLLRARAALVEKADALAALIAREQGKPPAEAH